MDEYRYNVRKFKHLMEPGVSQDGLEPHGEAIRRLAKDLPREEQHFFAVLAASLRCPNSGLLQLLTNVDIIASLRIMRENAMAEGRRQGLTPHSQEYGEEFRP